MTARLIPGKTRGHSLRLRAIALALRRPRLQSARILRHRERVLKPATTLQSMAAKMIDDLWYKNAVIYSLNVGAFMDSNGDGVGDFEGLSRRLDYLSGLGVTCIWLQQFHPSPYRDFGYDVSDYYGVDPRYGSSGDFVDFANQAKQRGIKIIIDLAVNHTSDQHPWFRSARSD